MAFPARGDTPTFRDELIESQALIPPGFALMVAVIRPGRASIVFRNIEPTGAGGFDLWVGSVPGVGPGSGTPLNSGIVAGQFGDAIVLETTAAVWIFNPAIVPVPVSILETATTG